MSYSHGKGTTIMARETLWIRQLMYRPIQQGTSFNSFYRSLVRHGYAGNRAQRLADWQSVKLELSQQLPKFGIDLTAYPETVTAPAFQERFRGLYMYKVKGEIKRIGEEEIEEAYVWVKAKKPLTYREILADASEAIIRYGEPEEEKLLTLEVTKAVYTLPA